MEVGFFSNASVRTENYGVFIWKLALRSAIMAGVVIYLGYAIAIGFGALIDHPRMDVWGNNVISGKLFWELLGEDYSFQHPVSYYLL